MNLHGLIITTPNSVYIRVHSWCCVFCGFGQPNIMTCIHHYGILQTILTALEILCVPPTYSFLPRHPQPLATTGLFIVSIVLPFSEHHVVGIIQYVVFSDQLLSLSHMH